MFKLNCDIVTSTVFSSSFENGYCAKLMTFSPSPTNKTVTSDNNFLQIRVYQVSEGKSLVKEFYVDSTITTPILFDLTGDIPNNFECFIAKENDYTNDYGLFIKPSLSQSIVYVQVIRTNGKGFFNFNMYAEFNITKDNLFNVIEPLTNIKITTPNFQNGWTKYNSSNPTEIIEKGNSVEIICHAKGSANDGTLIFNIPDKLAPRGTISVPCLTYNGSSNKLDGIVTINSSGEVKVYNLSNTAPLRLMFHVNYFKK